MSISGEQLGDQSIEGRSQDLILECPSDDHTEGQSLEGTHLITGDR